MPVTDLRKKRRHFLTLASLIHTSIKTHWIDYVIVIDMIRMFPLSNTNAKKMTVIQ